VIVDNISDHNYTNHSSRKTSLNSLKENNYTNHSSRKTSLNLLKEKGIHTIKKTVEIKFKTLLTVMEYLFHK